MSQQTYSAPTILEGYPHGVQVFGLVIFITSASTSLIMFFFGLLIVYKRPWIWKSIMFRVLLSIQIINCLRFVLRLIITYAPITSEFGCRVLLALNNGVANMNICLCMYITVYLQLTIINHLSPYKTWPRVTLMTFCVMCSFGSQIVCLIISRKSAGVTSFCSIPFTSNVRFFHVLIGTVVVWPLLVGIVCLTSITIIAIHIIRASRQAKKIILNNQYTYGNNGREHTRSTAELLNRTLRTVVWFPIAPIISQWFNSALIIVRHYTADPHFNLEYINLSLFSLMTIFMAAAFVFNPMVMDFLRDYRRLRSSTRRGHSVGQPHQHPGGLNFRIHSFSSYSSLELGSQLPLADLYCTQ